MCYLIFPSKFLSMLISTNSTFSNIENYKIFSDSMLEDVINERNRYRLRLKEIGEYSIESSFLVAFVHIELFRKYYGNKISYFTQKEGFVKVFIPINCSL